jgi:uncharacterized protein YjeT (DUF2065 family)
MKHTTTRIAPQSRLAASLVGAALALVLVLGGVLAVGEPPLRSTISSGGGEISSGELRLQTSIGQPVVGAVSNETYELCSGLICGSGAPGLNIVLQKVYLPLVEK